VAWGSRPRCSTRGTWSPTRRTTQALHHQRRWTTRLSGGRDGNLRVLVRVDPIHTRTRVL
jgi:hypothetical protein